MRVPALRLAFFSNFVKQNPFIHYKSISSLAQVSTYNSDSGSDEQSSPHSIFLQKNDQFVGFNTFRVTEMIHKLRNEPANAYSLFCQLKASGYKHDVDTYVAIIRILCYWGMDMKLDSILREVIQSEKSHLGFNISDLYELLVEEALKPGVPYSLTRAFDALLKVYISLRMFDEAFAKFIDTLFQTRREGFIHIRTVNYFLNCLIECNETEKIDTAVAIYEELKRRGLNPNVYTYGIVIKAHCIKGSIKEALDVLKDMEEARVTPSSWTYTICIEGLCNTGHSDLGYEFLQECRSKGNMAFDVFAYMVIIRGFVRENKFEKAELIMNEMEELGLFPDQDCYRVLIQGYCEIGDRKKCFALHNKMLSKGINTNCVIVSIILQCLYELGKNVKVVKTFKYYNGLGIYLDVVPFSIVVNALCKLRKVEEAMGFIIKKMDLNVRIYTSLMNGYLISKKPRDALIIFEEMEKRVKPDDVSYNCLAYGLSRNGAERLIPRVFHDMKLQGLEPTTTTHKMILEGLCIEGKVKEAIEFLSFIGDKSPDIYAAMICGCCRSQDKDKADKAYDLFLTFSQQNIVLTRSCYLKLLKLLCYKGELNKARKIYGFTISAFDNKPCKIMHRKLVAALCQAGDIREARVVFDTMRSHKIIPDVYTYTIMLKGYCSKTLMRHACDLFEEMKENEVKADVTAYTILIDKYYKLRNYGKARRLFKMMMFAGLEPDKVMYKARISAYLDKPNIHKVVSLFNEMTKKGMYPDKFTVWMIHRGLLKACGIRVRR